LDGNNQAAAETPDMAFGVVFIDSTLFHNNLGSMGFWEFIGQVYDDARIIVGYILAVATTVGMFFWLAYMALTWVEGVDPDYGRADIFADPLDTEEELAPDPEGFDGVETQGENFIRYEGSVKANPESPKKNSIDLEIS